MKQLFSLILIISSIYAFGQNFLEKPFLEMRTNMNGKEEIYRLKTRNKLWIKTYADNVSKKDRIAGFTKDSALILNNHDTIRLSNIEYICFTPVKDKRTAKQVVYILGGSIDLLLITGAALASPSEANAMTYGSLFAFTTITTVLFAQIVGGITYATTKKVLLYKENTRFIIRYK
jgi:hypothetical protein